MVEMLESRFVDVALTVTDALIVAVENKKKVRLAGVYVMSPLRWAICMDPSNKIFQDLQSLRQQRRGISGLDVLEVGISRFGSGSHTMAFVMADHHNLLKPGEGSPLRFQVANNFDGLRKGIEKKTFDLFLWETFTTQPYFKSGQLYKFGEVAPPWPAFSFAVSDNLLADKLNLLQRCFFPALREGIVDFLDHSDRSVQQIVNRFHHSPEDAAMWLSQVRYNLDPRMIVDASSINRSITCLKKVGLLSNEFSAASLFPITPSNNL